MGSYAVSTAWRSRRRPRNVFSLRYRLIRVVPSSSECWGSLSIRIAGTRGCVLCPAILSIPFRVSEDSIKIELAGYAHDQAGGQTRVLSCRQAFYPSRD